MTQLTMKMLRITQYDLAHTNITHEFMELQSHFIDVMNDVYYVPASNRYCSWLIIQMPNLHYVDLDVKL